SWIEAFVPPCRRGNSPPAAKVRRMYRPYRRVSRPKTAGFSGICPPLDVSGRLPCRAFRNARNTSAARTRVGNTRVRRHQAGGPGRQALFGGPQLRRLRLLGRLLFALPAVARAALCRDFAQLPHHGAGTRRDQPADDDILFQPVEGVHLAVHRGFGEHARRLLERCRGDERAGLQRRLGDAEQHRVCFRGLAALGLRPIIDLVELDPVDLLALDQLGLPGIVDLDLLQHLANDHLDVLVVDVDALQAIDLLDLVDEIGGEILDALDRQNVVRRRIALDDELTLFDDVAILQMDVLALGDEVFDRLDALLARLDGEPALVLVVAAEPHGSGDLGDHRRFLGPASLEQLRPPRQAAGDVARLGAFGRDAGDDVAGFAPGARIDRDHRLDRELVARLAAAPELEDLAVLAALDDDRRAQIL